MLKFRSCLKRQRRGVERDEVVVGAMKSQTIRARLLELAAAGRAATDTPTIVKVRRSRADAVWARAAELLQGSRGADRGGSRVIPEMIQVSA
jgi:hypothetical protein